MMSSASVAASESKVHLLLVLAGAGSLLTAVMTRLQDFDGQSLWE